MDNIATVEPLINPSKPPPEIEISKALTLMGYGSWTGLEPKTEKENFNYVPKKLNKQLFIKLQKIEEKKLAEYHEKKKLEKLLEQSKGSAKKKKSKQSKEEIEKMKLKQSNFVEQERAIHEAYQLILNEYYRKVKQRRKAMSAGAAVFGKLQKNPNLLDEMVANNSALSDTEEKVQDELDQFNITDAKSLLEKMEERKLSKSTSNLSEEPEDKVQFKNKVKKMQTNKALGKLLCNVGEERFNRIKKEKMEEQMGFNHVTRLDVHLN